jgi:uncharacterized protein DUF4214/methyltransferase family protein
MSLFRRLAARLEPVLQSDTDFLKAAYREILGRDADREGLDHYRKVLRDGMSRTFVLVSLMRSREFTSRLIQAAPVGTSLRDIRPGYYRDAIDRTNGDTIVIFDAASPSDVDWLESSILEHGYYERPGVWSFGVDTDKRVIAEIVASFAPGRALELGCAAGAVLECLRALGVDAEGVDISSLALSEASADIRPRIHLGDLLTLDLPGPYDVVFGLDIFEHLNPNRLDTYIRRIAQLVTPEGYLFCNIPAFGHDPVFGTVFPFYVDGWAEEAAAGHKFSTFHVDELGYPLHGHLIWADARWWVAQFEACGFRRQPDIERALHGKYDAYMKEKSPARLAYFVFSREPQPAQTAAIAERIRRETSKALLPKQ